VIAIPLLVWLLLCIQHTRERDIVPFHLGSQPPLAAVRET
jgi:hypothetical protein